MRLSVVVPTRDRPELLAGCLAAVEPQLRPDDELVVVDSAGHRPVVAPRVLRVDVPGTSRARNAGWRATTGEAVAFLDDDVRVAAGWRDAVEQALDGVAFACGRVAVPPGQEGVERPVAVTPDVPEQPIDPSRVIGVSANLVVRRDALVASAGFDERLGPGTSLPAAEDLELLDRLLAAGHPGRYAPSLLAFHEQWRDRRQLLRLDWGYGKGAGARAVFAGGARGRRLAREALWEQGIRPVPGDLGRGYQYGVLTGLVRTGGVLAGLVAARRVRGRS